MVIFVLTFFWYLRNFETCKGLVVICRLGLGKSVCILLSCRIFFERRILLYVLLQLLIFFSIMLSLIKFVSLHKNQCTILKSLTKDFFVLWNKHKKSLLCISWWVKKFNTCLKKLFTH